MSAEERAARTASADALCAEAYATSGAPEGQVALVAVGGFGRGELAPRSDLDVVLVHDDGVEPGEWAASVWYPMWDSGVDVDHSVRSLGEAQRQAADDPRVALGLLDARHLAGDPNLTLRLRSALLTQWRRDARERLPELHRLVTGRADLLGELAHSSVPDLKESVGGLRDATVLKALVASWLVDVPHADLERARTTLLDVRDELHAVAGRSTDRIVPEYWADLAERLGLDDATHAQRHVRSAGRRITHLSRLTWSRAESVLRRPPARGGRRPRLEPVGGGAGGVAVAGDEVVLAASARPAGDPALLLRAAAEAAERGLPLAPATAARLVRECPPLPEPWPASARDLLVRLLASGRGLLAVWETLDETGAIDGFLPEWEQVRLLPHASVVHRFTVDRHLVETCVEASALIRRVAEPDVLMVAALLHDIGKGGLVEHSVAGEPVARAVAARMGFDEREIGLVGLLVRRHLLLPEVATTRDPDDPDTLRRVLDVVDDAGALQLLAALTEADARATSDQAWTSWRASLVHRLVRRTEAALELGPARAVREGEDRPVGVAPEKVRRDPDAVWVQAEPADDGCQVSVVARDRVGLLADVAATLALQRAPVRAARAWTSEEDGATFAHSQWQVADVELDASVLLQRLENIVTGRLDAVERLSRRSNTDLAPTVGVRPEASSRATVIEVRAADRPGVVHTVCRALAGLRLSVRSMHVTTLGPQAVDVFYVQEEAAGVLGEERAAEAAHAVRLALIGE